jgi:hypothetical protein
MAKSCAARSRQGITASSDHQNSHTEANLRHFFAETLTAVFFATIKVHTQSYILYNGQGNFWLSVFHSSVLEGNWSNIQLPGKTFWSYYVGHVL